MIKKNETNDTNSRYNCTSEQNRAKATPLEETTRSNRLTSTFFPASKSKSDPDSNSGSTTPTKSKVGNGNNPRKPLSTRANELNLSAKSVTTACTSGFFNKVRLPPT